MLRNRNAPIYLGLGRHQIKRVCQCHQRLAVKGSKYDGGTIFSRLQRRDVVLRLQQMVSIVDVGAVLVLWAAHSMILSPLTMVL